MVLCTQWLGKAKDLVKQSEAAMEAVEQEWASTWTSMGNMRAEGEDVEAARKARLAVIGEYYEEYEALCKEAESLAVEFEQERTMVRRMNIVIWCDKADQLMSKREPVALTVFTNLIAEAEEFSSHPGGESSSGWEMQFPVAQGCAGERAAVPARWARNDAEN